MSGRLFFAIGIGFIIGIFLESIYALSTPYIGVILILSFVFFGGWFFARRSVYILFGVLLCFVALGMARTALEPTALPHAFVQDIGEKVTVSGIVVSVPDKRDTTQRFIVSVFMHGAHTRILAVTSLARNISYGSHVVLRGKLSMPAPFRTKYRRTFHYEKYLSGKGVFAILPYASVRSVTPPTSVMAYVYNSLASAKSAFLRALDRALPEPSSSLAGGLIAGGTRGLGSTLLDDFIRSGLIHIVVLSGYNVMIIADALRALLSFLSRKWSLGIAALAIGLFVLGAGAGAASIRAGLMALFALLARATGRTYDVTRALTVAVVLMLIWNPMLLVNSVGFDLSFVATLGLIFGVPIIEPHLSFIKSNFLRETVAATTVAQIAVLPLLMYTNGLLSLVSFFANVLVLPMVPLAMALSAGAGVVALIIPTLATVAGLPAYVILHLIIGLVHFTAHIPFAVVLIPQFSFVWVVFAYATLAFYMWRHRMVEIGRL
ncbi:MAG TPA: ComEC family competence protein [Candidatus Kaiserbacteria bacterium]|nr:ComEC family competence protein [Candidatus Kaiserbacteria bacterium]